MPDMLKTGMEWLDEQRQAHMSQAVDYSHGGETISILATAARSTFEQRDEDGGLLRDLATKDWIVSTADMVIDSLAFEPTPGDLITLNRQVYEVSGVGGEPCWRWSDEYRVMMRIHTHEKRNPTV